MKKINKQNQKNNIFSMSGKVVMIFGGSGKLGIQFSKILKENGAKVYLLDKKRVNKNEYFIKCDVQKLNDIKNSFKKIINKEKKIDVIIYNVYSKPQNYYEKFENYKKKTWDNVLEANLTGAFLVSQSAINIFIKKKIKGNIIFLWYMIRK